MCGRAQREATYPEQEGKEGEGSGGERQRTAERTRGNVSSGSANSQVHRGECTTDDRGQVYFRKIRPPWRAYDAAIDRKRNGKLVAVR